MRSFGRVDDLEPVDPVGHVVKRVWVGRERDRRLVPGRERLGDRVGLVAEVEDERVDLVGVDPVQARECLDGGEPGEHLVDEHRVQERLVVARLELLGDDQHAELGAGEGRRRLVLGDAVHRRFGELDAVVVDAPGERDEGARVRVAVLGEVPIDRLLVADGVEAR